MEQDDDQVAVQTLHFEVRAVIRSTDRGNEVLGLEVKDLLAAMPTFASLLPICSNGIPH